jgi:hypothetical protein
MCGREVRMARCRRERSGGRERMEVGSRKRGRVKMGGMKGAEEGRNEPWAEAGSLRQRCVCKSGKV